MEDNKILVEELKKAWRDLGFEVLKNKKIKMEIFEPIFTQTYSLLTKYAAENSVDKNVAELIAEAFLFANIKDESLDSTCLASFVVTERMLHYYAFNTVAASNESTTIYIFEVRKEVPLNFNDVGETVIELARIFESIYWKKL